MISNCWLIRGFRLDVSLLLLLLVETMCVWALFDVLMMFFRIDYEVTMIRWVWFISLSFFNIAIQFINITYNHECNIWKDNNNCKYCKKEEVLFYSPKNTYYVLTFIIYLLIYLLIYWYVLINHTNFPPAPNYYYSCRDKNKSISQRTQ